MTSIFHHPYCKPFIRHPFERIKCFFISLKWAYQRIKKGYCDQDLSYGVENWLLEMLPEAIDEINKEDHRVPGIIHCEVVEEFGFPLEEYWNACNDNIQEIRKQVDAEAERRWHNILSRISFLLRESVDWKCTKPNTLEEEYSCACEKRRNQIEVPDFEELQKRYFEEENKLEEYREQCKKEAAELLIKWAGYMEI